MQQGTRLQLAVLGGGARAPPGGRRSFSSLLLPAVACAAQVLYSPHLTVKETEAKVCTV